MDQNLAKYRIGIWMKKWWWSPFVWMVDVVFQGAWVLYRINKDEGDKSLSLLTFQRHFVYSIFLKYSKEGRLSSTHVGIRNIPSDICYDNTKHYQVQSERRRTRNPFKYLRWSIFARRVNSLKSSTWYAKTLHVRCLKGFWIYRGITPGFCQQRHFSLLKSKTGVRSIKRTLYDVDLRDLCFDKFQWY